MTSIEIQDAQVADLADLPEITRHGVQAADRGHIRDRGL